MSSSEPEDLDPMSSSTDSTEVASISSPDVSQRDDISSLSSVVSADDTASSSSADSDAAASSSEGYSPTASVGSDTAEQMTKALLALNMNLSELSLREAVENGLQAFNSIPNACEPIVDAIRNTNAIKIHADSIKLHWNPEIGQLSDFVPHCKLLISANGIPPEASEAIVEEAKHKLEDFKQMFQGRSKGTFVMTVNEAPFIGVEFGTQISLVLRIGSVFNVPVFTAYVMRDVLNNAVLDSDETVGVEFTHNAKRIAKYSRLDVLLELLVHATEPDPYDAVNVLIARGINALIVSKFEGDPSPNAVIKTECDHFFALIFKKANNTVNSMIIKSVLIAIIQNPAVQTPDKKRFSDMFPSGQYVKYFGEVAYRAFKDQGPIMVSNALSNALSNTPESPGSEGEAPGVEGEVLPILPLASEVTEVVQQPLVRIDIIVAAFTAVNAAMGADAHIVAAGGTAVSYYIKDFVNDMNADAFHGDVIASSGLDVQALEDLKRGCDNIPMNDIDCFVFGEVSRQFLLLFSLYMMILYDNFYERPKRYGAITEPITNVHFNLSPTSSTDRIGLFMYGNHNNDANTKLISKRLKKNPKVQLVTQETKCFSQVANPMCGSSADNTCKEDGYYTQPIDLVKKEIGDFVDLYRVSLYTPDGIVPPEDLESTLRRQYTADNMVALKTTMLDVICIFCDTDKSLFIRIFMARKNPKDFARLRVFIDIYLLQLLRSNDATFLKHKDELIREITELRGMMTQLNE